MDLENRLNSEMNRQVVWMMSLRYEAHISALLILKAALSVSHDQHSISP